MNDQERIFVLTYDECKASIAADLAALQATLGRAQELADRGLANLLAPERGELREIVRGEAFTILNPLQYAQAAYQKLGTTHWSLDDLQGALGCKATRAHELRRLWQTMGMIESLPGAFRLRFTPTFIALCSGGIDTNP